jgi:NAD(P)-dependent dehydrogenase (short-subunit alcohol dehydrogenase family)
MASSNTNGAHDGTRFSRQGGIGDGRRVGIGRDAALRFAQAGALVYAADLNPAGPAATGELAREARSHVRMALADAAPWLSPPASSYVHGQLLVGDGGMTIGGFEP